MKKWLVRVALLAGAIAATFALAVGVVLRLLSQTNGTIVSSGGIRSYLLHVPKRYDPSVPTPLVITLHGFAQPPAHQMKLSHWNDLADQYGFIVVYPKGAHFPLRWRAGGWSDNEGGQAQDVRFISDLIDKLQGEYNIDPARIYANGMSNGGGMTFVLSCKLSERIAAVGMVAGLYLYGWEECRPVRQAPAIIFHGTADPIVPFQGGQARAFHAPFPAIPQWVDALAQRHGCAATPVSLPTGGKVSGVRYVSCASDVIFYTISGGGHTWPGGEVLPKWLTGHTTKDIDATQVMWDFFMQHPLPAP